MTHRRNIVRAIWPVIFLAFCSWVVWLGGLASVQKDCTTFNNPLSNIGIPNLPGVGGCAHLYQFWWWVWAFEFLFVVGIAVTLVVGHLRSTRVMWTGLLAVICVLKIFGSDTFIFHLYRYTGSYHTRLQVTAAGFIMSSVLNLLLLILVALDPQPSDAPTVSDSGVHVTKTHTVPVATGTHLATEGPGPTMV